MNHPNVDVLQEIYTDATSLRHRAADDIVLHPADRSLDPVVGMEAVIDHVETFNRLTGYTRVMDVQDIVANDHFGAVLGVLRATINTHDIAMPFCGLWRFHGGRIIEHWENPYDAGAIGRALAASR
ncbi:nuclear transport factor 2 family protein [Nocardia sp. NPDC051929]|uniref:nuclear transport factor 2 family protein n=1 Tax=unclassified Nocardia TaxID=2637762 RepID=UPI0034223EFF